MTAPLDLQQSEPQTLRPAMPNTALLLLGHGSSLNADSSAPTYQHAEEIRRRGIFAEVHVSFWKEEPNFHQALRQTACPQVYVVPNFISSGYFSEQVIPRELGLTGPVTRIGNQDIFYCDPVGLHPAMTDALLARAREVVVKSGEGIAAPARTACVFICGHGTSFNDNSTKIIHEQAQIIRGLGIYSDCQAVLMEQTPFVKDWRILTSCPDVIVVPFFIADGLHSFEDIPVLLGLTHNIREKGFCNPHREGKRRLWYSTAIGTEAFLSDVIIAQVEQSRKTHGIEVSPRATALDPLENELGRFFREQPAPWRIGQVAIEAGYCLTHMEDLGQNEALQVVETLEDLREVIRLDGSGNFRPLRAAPNLRRGWKYEASDLVGVMLALDYLYPAGIANWHLGMNHQLPVFTWQDTADRQTGRFRVVCELEPAALSELVDQICERGCLKHRLWAPAAEAETVDAGSIPLLCPEACNYFVGKARERLKGGSEE